MPGLTTVLIGLHPARPYLTPYITPAFKKSNRSRSQLPSAVVRRSESSGKWNTKTGNGYAGGLQFDQATWDAYGGSDYAPSADQASKDQQIAVAEKVRDDRGGYSSWPACSQKLGLPQ